MYYFSYPHHTLWVRWCYLIIQRFLSICLLWSAVWEVSETQRWAGYTQKGKRSAPTTAHQGSCSEGKVAAAVSQSACIQRTPCRRKEERVGVFKENGGRSVFQTGEAVSVKVPRWWWTLGFQRAGVYYCFIDEDTERLREREWFTEVTWSMEGARLSPGVYSFYQVTMILKIKVK